MSARTPCRRRWSLKACWEMDAFPGTACRAGDLLEGTVEKEAAQRGSGFKKWKLKRDVRQRPLQPTVWRCSFPRGLFSLSGQSEKKVGQLIYARFILHLKNSKHTGWELLVCAPYKPTPIYLLLFKKIIQWRWLKSGFTINNQLIPNWGIVSIRIMKLLKMLIIPLSNHLNPTVNTKHSYKTMLNQTNPSQIN